VIKEFASLHNHSHFSVFDGISLPEEMVLTAKRKGLKSIAVTDHGHCHAHADFYLMGKKHGVRTVLGVEAYLIHDLDEWKKFREQIDFDKKMDVERDSNSGEQEEIKDKSIAKQLYRKGHLVLLACNQKGLSNLYQLTFKSHKIGFYSKPRMDKKMLEEHAEGLVATSACMGGVISNKCWDLKNGRADWSEVVQEALHFDRIFGRGRFFLELQFNEADSQRYINDCLVRIHKETGIPLTVTTDSHYTRQEEWEAQELLYMLRSNKTIATRGPDWSFEVKQLYVKSPEEMWQTFEKFGGTLEPKIAIEAFQNTLLIDSLIDTFEPDTHQRLPTLPYKNPFAEMGNRAIEGLKKLGLADRDEYKARMLHELKVIKEKGISNYFLIVQKMIEEAKKEMLVGAVEVRRPVLWSATLWGSQTSTRSNTI
jgi:DNA polymerase-3 subunit alpha